MNSGLHHDGVRRRRRGHRQNLPRVTVLYNCLSFLKFAMSSFLRHKCWFSKCQKWENALARHPTLSEAVKGAAEASAFGKSVNA